jgi:hypothetical protein
MGYPALVAGMELKVAQGAILPRPEMKRKNGLGCWGFYGFYGDKTASPAAVNEVHLAGYFGVEGVVFAPADVQTGLQLGAALTDDDGTTGDYLASKDLYTQSLSVGVAAVFGTA